MQDRLDKNQRNNVDARNIPGALSRGIDSILNIALLTVICIHLAYRTGLLFTNPLSDRLKGKHTFWWFLGTFIVWLAWKLPRGRFLRSKPSA